MLDPVATKYIKIGTLGDGGMAHVTLAMSHGPADVRKLVVIKEVKPELAKDESFVKMFLEEARLSCRLQHPNIVHTYDVASAAGKYSLIMEFLDGQPLNKVRSVDGWSRLPFEFHLKILSETLEALHYAHELKDFDGTPMGLVHRDVSPQNVFVCYDGRVVLVDFGVAKARGAQVQTATGVVKGKLSYIAPEGLSGATLDRRADVFSLGVMLWEAVAKRRISEGKTDIEVAGMRIVGAEPRLEAVVPGVPPALAEMCAKAMARDPNDRFGNALEFKDRLDSLVPSWADRVALAEFVSTAFAESKARVSRLVQEHLATLAATPRKPLPSIEEEDATLPNRFQVVRSSPLNIVHVSPRRPKSPPSTVSPSRRTIRGGLIAALAVAVGVGFGIWRLSASANNEPASPSAFSSTLSTTGPAPPLDSFSASPESRTSDQVVAAGSVSSSNEVPPVASRTPPSRPTTASSSPALIPTRRILDPWD